MSMAEDDGTTEAMPAGASARARRELLPAFNVSLTTAAVVVFFGHLLTSQFFLAWFRQMWVLDGSSKMPSITSLALQHTGIICVCGGISALASVGATIYRPRRAWPLAISMAAILANLFLYILTVMAIVVPVYCEVLMSKKLLMPH